MFRTPLYCLLVILTCNSFAMAQRILNIGNSLTWDTLPAMLDGDVQWHVDCNKNLTTIFNSTGPTCVSSSTRWDLAMRRNDFDFVTFQPFVGTTLSEDVRVVSEWMRREPNAQFVLHTGWSNAHDVDHNYVAPNTDDQMRVSMSYFRDLTRELEEAHPGRVIGSTNAASLLRTISLDVQAGSAPIRRLEELYRDSIHMNVDEGRYLMHNAMRHALGQPFSTEGFDIDSATAAYFNRKIRQVSLANSIHVAMPEPVSHQSTVSATTVGPADHVESIADSIELVPPQRETKAQALPAGVLVETMFEISNPSAAAFAWESDSSAATPLKLTQSTATAATLLEAGTTATTVPEPQCVLLLLVGLSGLARGRAR